MYSIYVHGMANKKREMFVINIYYLMAMGDLLSVPLLYMCFNI